MKNNLIKLKRQELLEGLVKEQNKFKKKAEESE